MNFFPVLNHWIHLVSVVLWIGGLAFQIFIIAPLLKSNRLTPVFLKNMSLRFRYMAGPLLLVLAVTGGINFHFRRAGYETIPPGYISALGIKVFLFSIVASFYLFEILLSRQNDAAEKSSASEPGLPGFTLTRLTLAIGIVIIFLAAMLRHWKF